MNGHMSRGVLGSRALRLLAAHGTAHQTAPMALIREERERTGCSFRSAVARLAQRIRTTSRGREQRLLRDLLQLLFHTPDIRTVWKDRLSDWIVDLTGGGQGLTASALVQPLARYHPEVLRRLAVHPLVKEGLRELVTRAAAR